MSGMAVVFGFGLVVVGAVLVGGLVLMVFGIVLTAVASIRHTSEAVASGLVDASFGLIFGALAAAVAWGASWAIVALSVDFIKDVIA